MADVDRSVEEDNSSIIVVASALIILSVFVLWSPQA